MKTLIIAEAGVNHNGSIKNAFKLIDAAKNAGADVVKFQTAVPSKVMIPTATKARYQKLKNNDNETQLSMANKIHLKISDFLRIKKYCNYKKIKFLSSPFDSLSLKQLIKLKVDTIKIPSGEITNVPFLEKIGSTNKKIILSTGMSNFKEINFAINLLVKNGIKRKKISVLHCNTAYPSPFRDLNLNAIKIFKSKLKLKIGYSDHSVGIEGAIAAVACGAEIIEKHLTLSNNLKGPDHKSSLNPKNFKYMVECIRNIEQSLGYTKKLTKSEKENFKIVRRSIVAIKNIKAGEKFKPNNIDCKRPMTGIPAEKWHKIINKKSKKNYKVNQLIID